MKKTQKKIYFFAVALSVLFIIGIGHQANEVSAATTDLHQAANGTQYDRVLKVFMACPKEVDKNDTIDVVTTGLRLGKGVTVDPDEVRIALTDESGFELANRSWVRGVSTSENPKEGVIPIYEKIFMTRFRPIQYASDFEVKAEITYTAPWGEKITSSTTQKLKVRRWFNITETVQDTSDAINFQIDTKFSRAANLTKRIAGRLRNITQNADNHLEVLEKDNKWGITGRFNDSWDTLKGTLDKTWDDMGLENPLKFLPIYFPDFNTSFFSDKEDYKMANGETLDPNSYMQSFIHSLDLFVEKDIPFRIYTIQNTDDLLGYTQGRYHALPDLFGTYGSTILTDTNPLNESYTLSYDHGDQSDWVSGSGIPNKQNTELNLTNDAEIQHRMPVINMYDQWLPMPETWMDYRLNATDYDGESTIGKERNAEFDSFKPWMWAKEISMGLSREHGMLYNVNGEIMKSIFVIDETDQLNNDYKIRDVKSVSGERSGLTLLNDWCLFEFNDTLTDLNMTGEEIATMHTLNGTISDTSMRWVGRKFDDLMVNSSRNGIESTSSKRLDTDRDGTSVSRSFAERFFSKEYPDIADVTENSTVITYEDDIIHGISHSEYSLDPNGDYAAVGIRFAPSTAFGYTSLKNTTLGFEMLHASYFQLLRDYVRDLDRNLEEGAQLIEAENSTKASYYRDLRNRIKNAWLDLDINKLGDLFYEYRVRFYNKTLPWTANKTDDLSSYNHNELKEDEELAVQTNEGLETADSDLSFDFFGNLLGGTGAITGVIGGAIVGGGIGFAVGGPAGALIGAGIGAAAGGLIGGISGWMMGNNMDSLINGLLEKMKGVIDTVLGKIKEVLNEILKTIEKLIEKLFNLIKQVIEVVLELAEMVTESLYNLSEVINNVSTSIQDVVDWGATEFAEHAENVRESFTEIKETVMKSTDFYFDVRDTVYRKLSESESAAGAFEWAAQESGLTEDVFFKEVDILKPMAEKKSAENGLYVVQMGDETVSDLFYVTLYRGKLVDVDSLNMTAQTTTNIVDMDYTKCRDAKYSYDAFGNDPAPGLYKVETERLADRDYMTKMDVEYNNDGKKLDAFTVERTTKISPKLQDYAFPVIDFDPSTVNFITGQNYLLPIYIDNLMYSDPEVMIQVELISSLGLSAGSKEEIVQLNPEGDESIITELEANLPFYVPPGDYQLIIRVVQKSGDVTRKVYMVEVSSDNFLYSLIGGLLSMLGMGVIISKYRKKNTQKRMIGNLAQLDKVNVKSRKKAVFDVCNELGVSDGICSDVRCDPNDLECQF